MKYRTVLVAIVVLLGLTTQLFAAEVEDKFKEGQELLDAWRISQAEELAAKSLRDNPKSPDALDFDARVKFYQGRYQEALASIDRALAIDSK